MMIKSITMRGIKAANGVQELTGRDIIIGSNGSGKTTRSQAIGIALMGYVPGGGRLPSETLKLARESSMTVGIETETFSIHRNFERKGSDTKQTLLITPPFVEKTVAAKEKRIETELGKLPVMLDFGEFLNLTDMKRREFIYSLAAGTGSEGTHAAGTHAKERVSKESIAERLLRQLVPRLAPQGGKDRQALDIAVKSIGECMRAYPDDAGAQTGLQSMLEYAKEQLSYWKKEYEKSIGASQKIAEYKNDLAQTDQFLDENSRRLDAVQAEMSQAAALIAKLEAENREFHERDQKIIAIRAEIDSIEQSVNMGSADDMRALIAQYSADLRNVDNSERIATVTADVEAYEAMIAELENGIADCRNEYSAVEAKKAANEALSAKLMLQSGTCPIDCRIECDKDFSSLLKDINAENMGYEGALRSIGKRGSALNATHYETRQAAQEARSEINRLRQEEISALRENEQIHAITREIEGDIAKLESFEATKTARLTAKREELNGITPPDGAPFWVFTDIESVNDNITGLANEAQNLRGTIAEQTKARNTLLNLKNSIIDSEVSGYHTEVWKSIAEAVGPKGLQGELVKDVLAPLTEDIQAKLRQMDINRTFFFQTEDFKGKEVFQFGWQDAGGERRNFDALSTGEQMLILIALMTTIIERLNPPLKVLSIDNAENLDADNLRRVLKGLLAAGTAFDNILLLGVMRIAPNDAAGWRVWDLNTSVTGTGTGSADTSVTDTSVTDTSVTETAGKS